MVFSSTLAFDAMVPMSEELFTSKQSYHVLHEFGDLRVCVKVWYDDGAPDEFRPWGSVRRGVCVTASLSVDDSFEFAGKASPPLRAHFVVKALEDERLHTLIDRDEAVSRCVTGMVDHADSLEELRSYGFLTSYGVLHLKVEVHVDLDAVSIACNQYAGKTWAKKMLYSMWQDRCSADFFIVTNGGVEVKCHRAVVAAASPVFQRMLSGGMQESRQPYVTVEECPRSIAALVEFMYTGQLGIDVDCFVILSLLRLADYYQVPRLGDICCERLLPMVSNRTVADILRCVVPLRHTAEMHERLFQAVVQHVRGDETLVVDLCIAVGRTRERPADMTESGNNKRITHNCRTNEKENVRQKDGASSRQAANISSCNDLALPCQHHRANTGCSNEPAHISMDSLSTILTESSGEQRLNQSQTTDLISTNVASTNAPYATIEGFVDPGRQGHEVLDHQGKGRRRTRRGGVKYQQRLRNDQVSIPGTHNSFD